MSSLYFWFVYFTLDAVYKVKAVYDNDNDILFNLLSYRVTFMMRMINCDKMLSGKL